MAHPSSDHALEGRRRPLAPIWTDENLRHADSKSGALRPLQEEVAVRYKELVKREQALAAREQLASEVCEAQELREQDLEALALRLQQQEQVLQQREVAVVKDKQAQEAASRDVKATDVEVAGLRLSERAGRLATREKRVADDEAELLRRERNLAVREGKLEDRQEEVAEAESRNMREFASRRRSVELREMRAAELESRLAWTQQSLENAGSIGHDPTADSLPRPTPPCRVSARRANTFGQSRERSLAREVVEPSWAEPPRLAAGPGLREAKRMSHSRTEEVPEITGIAIPQSLQASIEFHDAVGNLVAFKLNGHNGVDYYVNGAREVCNADCYTRGRTLHLAGSRTGKWSPARTAVVPQGQEAVLQRVMALFHRGPEDTQALGQAGKPRPSAAPELAEATAAETPSLIGPGEELTTTVYVEKPPHRNSVRTEYLSKAVRFDELLSRQAPPLPPASWERTCGDLASEFDSQDPDEEAASRPRLTARKQTHGEATNEIKASQDEVDEKSGPWLARLRRLTRCG